MSRKKCWLLLILMICITTVEAQQKMQLTLPQVIKMAQEQSPVAIAIRSRAESSYWQYKAAKASRLPQLLASGDVPGINRRINSVTQPDGRVIFVAQSQAISTSTLSLSQNINATGGNLSISSGLTRIDLFGDAATSFWQSTPLLFGYNQPLFQFNELKWNWKQARLRYTQATQQEVEQLEDLSARVIQSFFDLYIAESDARIAKLNAEVNDTIFKISKGRYNLGKIAENELLQSELTLMNAQNSYQQAMIRLKNSQNILKNLLDLPEDTDLELIPPSDVPSVTVDIDKALAEAHSNRSDIIGFMLQQQSAEMDVKRAAAGRRLNANMSMSYGLNQTADNIDNVYTDPLDQQRFTVGFNIPLVSWGQNKANYMVAKKTMEATQADLELAQKNFDQEVIGRVLEYNQLKTSLQIAAKSDTIAQKRYNVTKNRYLIGKIDMTNLIIAQNEKDQARVGYVRTLQNYWSTYYQLRRFTLYDFEKGAKISY